MESGNPSTNRPYTPPSNVTIVLQRLRSRNMPERVDAEYLRDAGVPEGTNARTLFALRFLGLLEGDAPTSALRSIATSTDEEYQAILAALVRDAYHEVFEVIDPTQDPQDRIINFFRRYTPASQRERMVVFFLGMCREAGIPTLDVPRQRASGGSSGPKAAGAKASKSTSRPTTPRSASRSRVQAPNTDNKSLGQGNVSLAPALELLVRSLPEPGTAMSEDRREQWLTMARAALAFVYPEPGGRNARTEEEEEELGEPEE